MKGHVDALLKKFLYIADVEPTVVEASSGDDGSNDVDDALPATKTGDGNGQGGGGASS